MKTRAAVLHKHGESMQLENLELAVPTADEVIVQISHVGICHTDIGAQKSQPLPAVLGHEGTGVVIECGDAVDDLAIGDRVVLTYGSCGNCRNCQAELPSHCEQMPALNFSGYSPDGQTTLQDSKGNAVHGSFFYQSSFASHAIANQRNAIKVPDDLPPELLAPLGCGVQTGVGAVVNTLSVPAGSSMVCIGVGSVGLSAVMAAKMVGCTTIIAVDREPSRLEMAEALGATHVLPGNDETVAAVHQITSGGADYCFESAGNVATFHAAIESVRMGGHVGLAAVPEWAKGFHFYPGPLAMGRTITGVLEGSSVAKTFIPKLCDWLRDGSLPLHNIVQTYAFDDINSAIRDLDAGRVIKPVLML
ncbi:MAG: NAD(P)-dependent alcohol dehydrogenase [Woeseiaceae bacterium]